MRTSMMSILLHEVYHHILVYFYLLGGCKYKIYIITVLIFRVGARKKITICYIVNFVLKFAMNKITIPIYCK